MRRALACLVLGLALVAGSAHADIMIPQAPPRQVEVEPVEQPTEGGAWLLPLGFGIGVGVALVALLALRKRASEGPDPTR